MPALRPKNRRITIALEEGTHRILEHQADMEGRRKACVAALLLEAAAEVLAADANRGVAAVSRQLCGEGRRRLDPAELRAKSREKLSRLEGLLSEVGRESGSLRSTLEDEARAARLVKVRRFKLARAAGEVQS